MNVGVNVEEIDEDDVKVEVVVSLEVIETELPRLNEEVAVGVIEANDVLDCEFEEVGETVVDKVAVDVTDLVIEEVLVGFDVIEGELPFDKDEVGENELEAVEVSVEVSD